MKLNLFFYFIALILLPFTFASIKPTKSALAVPFVKMSESKPTVPTTPVVAAKPAFEIPKGLKLLIGAGGIYAAFLYYGTLQEDVFHYKAADGSKFKQAWFLQALGNKHN